MSPRAYRLALLVLLGMVVTHTPAWSDAVNGGFESGNLGGWTVEFTNVSEDGSGNRVFGTWSTTQPSGHPGARVIDGTEAPLPVVGSLVPYCDGFMAQINDPLGGSHATRIRQSIAITSNDLYCGAIKVRWGALLQVGGHHTDQQQAFFQIDIKVNGSVVETFAANSNDASVANGWTIVNDYVYTSGTFVHRLDKVDVGDDVEVIMMVADCTLNGHGGCAFIDCVTLDAPCGRSCPLSDPIPQPSIPNVFTPNGDGVNDIWKINNTQKICLIHIDIFDRFGLKVFTADKGLAYSGDNWSGWNGKINNTGADVTDGVYDYVVTAKNCADTETWTGTISIFR